MSIPQTETREDIRDVLARAHYCYVYYRETERMKAVEDIARYWGILDDVTRLSTERIRKEAS